ncbi:MAG: biotin/lipoyl-containing protein [Candidatus Acidiferrales bacterium]
MTTDTKQQKSFGGRWTYGVVIMAFLFVLMPFLFWNATWFGRPLTDAQIAKALADRSHPREIQHVLSQIETRIEAHDTSVRRWYPDLVKLAADPIGEIRVTDAWVMGQDNTSEDFHRALLNLLTDPNPMVQRNAALSLVRFGDDSGHALLVAMLRPYNMPSPLTGTLKTRLKPGDVVNPGTLLAHIESGGQSREVRATVPGTLERWLASNGATISAGQPLVSLAPSESMVWEALRALYLVGRTDDLTDVDRFTRGIEGFSPHIAQQAQATSRAIRVRSSP